MSSTTTYSTKNTKDNRKVVSAEYSNTRVFKIPDGLDLEDRAVVKEWKVFNCDLHILYVDGSNDCFECECKIESDCKDLNIEDAKDYDFEYDSDDEDVEEDEEEVEEEEEEEEDEDDEENTTKCECCGAINACAFPLGYEMVKKAE